MELSPIQISRRISLVKYISLRRPTIITNQCVAPNFGRANVCTRMLMEDTSYAHPMARRGLDTTTKEIYHFGETAEKFGPQTLQIWIQPQQCRVMEILSSTKTIWRFGRQILQKSLEHFSVLKMMATQGYGSGRA